MANKPFIIKLWSSDFNFENEVLKDFTLWIQLLNLPLNCWGADFLSRMGSVLEKPLIEEGCTTTHTRIYYAQLLVEVDVMKPKF